MALQGKSCPVSRKHPRPTKSLGVQARCCQNILLYFDDPSQWPAVYKARDKVRAARSVWGLCGGQKATATQGDHGPALPALGLLGQGVCDQAGEQPGHQSHHSVCLVRLSGSRGHTGAKGGGLVAPRTRLQPPAFSPGGVRGGNSLHELLQWPQLPLCA